MVPIVTVGMRKSTEDFECNIQRVVLFCLFLCRMVVGGGDDGGGGGVCVGGGGERACARARVCVRASCKTDGRTQLIT